MQFPHQEIRWNYGILGSVQVGNINNKWSRSSTLSLLYDKKIDKSSINIAWNQTSATGQNLLLKSYEIKRFYFSFIPGWTKNNTRYLSCSKFSIQTFIFFSNVLLKWVDLASNDVTVFSMVILKLIFIIHNAFSLSSSLLKFIRNVFDDRSAIFNNDIMFVSSISFKKL